MREMYLDGRIRVQNRRKKLVWNGRVVRENSLLKSN